ncbi:hypothetical protein ABVT39_009950 [Epinephelus coioides]
MEGFDINININNNNNREEGAHTEFLIEQNKTAAVILIGAEEEDFQNLRVDADVVNKLNSDLEQKNQLVHMDTVICRNIKDP